MTRLVALISLFLAFLAAPAFAQDRATPEEAQALAEKAAVFFSENGLQAAHDAFHVAGSQWLDRDLYVVAFDRNGINVIHGVKPALEGKDLLHLKDANGFEMTAAQVAITDRGWVEYKWQSPTTGKIEDKMTWTIRVGEYTVGVGAYK